MKQALNYLAEKSGNELSQHALYQWIGEQHDLIPQRKLDSAIPIVHFILTFPYYNNLYLFCAKTKGSLATLINAHAIEDASHARLFIEDMKQFALDKVWGLEHVSDWLWVIWSAPSLKPARHIGNERIRSLLASADNLYLKYLHIEQIENDGHYLFSAFSEAATAILRENSCELKYFGRYHLARESGHVALDDESTLAFHPTLLKQAKQLIDKKHQLSMAMNDLMYDFAKDNQGAAKPGLCFQEERINSVHKIEHALKLYEKATIPDLNWTISPTQENCDATLYARWQHQHERFLNHSLFDHIINTEDDIEYTLRTVLVYFANRMLSLNAFNLFVLESDENDDFSIAFRKIRNMFATHYEAFFYDWQQLDIDNQLNVSIPEYIELMFADKEHAEHEMQTIHEFSRQGNQIAQTKALKLWCYLALNCMAAAFTKATKVLAEKYYQRHGTRLAYLSGILHLSYGEVDSDWNNDEKIATLYAIALSDEEKNLVVNMMDTLCDLGIKHWDLVAGLLKERRSLFA